MTTFTCYFIDGSDIGTFGRSHEDYQDAINEANTMLQFYSFVWCEDADGGVCFMARSVIG